MSSGNWFGRRRSERDFNSRMESKLAYGNSNQTRSNSTASGANAGSHPSSSRDRLLYLSTCLIGNSVEVQLNNGSVYCGICYTTKIDKDFAIVLKMARMLKDTSTRGQKSEFISKAPSKTLVIPGKDLLQIIAKGVIVNFDELSSEFHPQKQHELLIDSFISKSRHAEAERELTPWMPDEDDTPSPDLENVFDSPWNRHWNQFETNAALFGVKSTFDEELYTTKLEKGPWMREIEKEASRIAREIEGEDTHDLHIAEERGMQLHESYDDEEMRFSSVNRGPFVDDSGYDDETMDLRSSETFGTCSTSNANADSEKRDATNAVSHSSLDDVPSSQFTAESDICNPVHNDTAGASFPSSETEFRTWIPKEIVENTTDEKFNTHKNNSSSNLANPHSSTDETVEVSNKPEPSNVATNYDPVTVDATKAAERVIIPTKVSETVGNFADVKCSPELQSLKTRVARPGSSASSTSDQEFKLNPNAKSFTPSRNVARPFQPPMPDTSFYYPPMPINMMQPVIYNNSGPPMQTPPAYYHPNGPPMILGPRQMVYMTPSFQPDVHYKGREF